jgi:transposase
MQVQSLFLRKKSQGGLPLVDHFLRRLGLEDLLSPQIAHRPYREALGLLVKSILLQPSALYRIEAWAQAYDPVWRPSAHLGDDALGRALDRLFEADRASLLTALILRAVRTFGIQTQQIHNDSTSVKFSGAYEHQKTKAVQLRRGRSKDHRPDLKQLVYSLSVSAEGAVPVHFKAYAGNQSDDSTHWETWQCLCQILGRADFLYVADSKLCVKETMLRLDGEHGRFITILPRTRSEWAVFAEHTADNQVRWEPLWNRRALRKGQQRELFELAAGAHRTAEGFALYWYRSSEKRQRDAQDRQQRLETALQRLERLNERRGSGPKTEPAVRRAAENILARYRVGSLVEYEIKLQPKVQFTQKTLRKPTFQIIRQRVVKPVPVLSARQNPTAIARAQSVEGTFPLVTNTDLSALEVLQKYKYQPHLEKRHCLGKSVLQISPVFLKNNTRIEALMFLYFIAELVAALIERTVQENMARRGIKALSILPERRYSKTPSYAQILDTFAARTKEEIYEKDFCIKTFVEPLTELQQMLLQLLEIDAAVYR